MSICELLLVSETAAASKVELEDTVFLGREDGSTRDCDCDCEREREILSRDLSLLRIFDITSLAVDPIDIELSLLSLKAVGLLGVALDIYVSCSTLAFSLSSTLEAWRIADSTGSTS